MQILDHDFVVRMGNLIYFFSIFIMACGLFVMLVSDNYIKKIIGLGIFQNSVLIFYIALGKVQNGIIPIEISRTLGNNIEYSNNFSSPVPHVLMLTAIVVGFATMSVALALIYQIRKQYGSLMASRQKI